MSAFIYPDSPGAEITPGYIGEIDPEVYLCQLKLDGWRAVVTWDGVNLTALSRQNKPIDFRCNRNIINTG